MAPSDDDDAPRVPDPGSPDADGPSELPTGSARRAIGPQRGDGVDPRPSGSVVFDVEVDDPSLVMPRPSRRARPKPAGEAPIEESEGELAELLPAALGDDDDGDRDGDSDRDDDDKPGGTAAETADDPVVETDGDDDEDDVEVTDPPRQLVSGDPLLTGPTPVVRRSLPSRSTATSRPDSGPAADEADATVTDEERSSEASPSDDESSDQDASVRREDQSTREEPARLPLSAKELFAPVTGEHAAVHTDVPPPPAPGAATTSSAPPPPPAPSLATGRTAPGAPPSVPGPVVPAARRASRGSQVTGQIPMATPARPDASGPIPAPRPTAVAPAPRVAGRRPRVRRVTRVVRHVDPWSVFKVAAVFSFVAYGIALVAGVLLWNVAYATGTVDNIERGLESTGWETFELNGGEIFHNAWIGGLFAAVGLTGLAVLVATLFNLITDLVGGVRMTVLEEEVVEKASSPMRRFSSRQAPETRSAPPPRRR